MSQMERKNQVCTDCNDPDCTTETAGQSLAEATGMPIEKVNMAFQYGAMNQVKMIEKLMSGQPFEPRYALAVAFAYGYAQCRKDLIQ